MVLNLPDLIWNTMPMLYRTVRINYRSKMVFEPNFKVRSQVSTKLCTWPPTRRLAERPLSQPMVRFLFRFFSNNPELIGHLSGALVATASHDCSIKILDVDKIISRFSLQILYMVYKIYIWFFLESTRPLVNRVPMPIIRLSELSMIILM